MKNKPNKALAVVLSLVFDPLLGLCYVRQPWWGFGLLAAALILALANILLGVLPLWLFAILLLAYKGGGAVLAFRFAKHMEDDTPSPAYSRWYGLLGIACIHFLLIWSVRAFGYEPFIAKSEAMSPTIPVGTRIVVKKWGYGHYTSFGIGLRGQTLSAPLVRGDIIVFDYPVDHTTSYIFRLIGLPGDTVAYQNKQLTINGKPWARRQIDDFISYDGIPGLLPRFIESNGNLEYQTLANDTAPPMHTSGVLDFPFKEKCQYDEKGFTCQVPPGHYFTMGDNRDNAADSRYWGFVPADHILGKVVK